MLLPEESLEMLMLRLPIQIHLRGIINPITNQPYRESQLTVVLVVVEDEDGGGVALPGVEVVFEVRDGA